MKFEFNVEKCSDIGLIVKHGNKDNVVLFFDEVENAATYKAVLFRTDVVYEREEFLSEGKITQKEIRDEETIQVSKKKGAQTWILRFSHIFLMII